MLPVTCGLGENAAGALNALVPVPGSGGGWRPCARRLLICSSLFPYSTVACARALIDSQDALSVFEAAVVEDHAHNWVGRRIGDLDLCTDILDIDISWGTPY